MAQVVGVVGQLASIGALIPGPHQPFFAVASFALSFAGGFLGGADRPKPRPVANDFASRAQDRVEVVRSAVASHKVVYGEAKLGGPIAFAASTGSLKDLLNLVVPTAGHEIEGYQSVFLAEAEAPLADFDGDGLLTTTRYQNKVRINFHNGTDGQAADADLVAKVSDWTNSHRLRGLSYSYLRLQYDRNVFPSGVPRLGFKVKGRKLWDPRDTSQDSGDSSTWLWSNNWALCVLDYLRADFGLQASLEEIDLPSFIAAANISDELVEMGTGESPSVQKRYVCDGVIDTADTPIDIMEDLLSAGAGALSYSQGKYHLFAGAYLSPTVTLTADDLAGPVEVESGVERRNLFNAVRGTFVDPEKLYEPTDFPMRTNATYEAEDGGVQIVKDIELPFTQDVVRAQRIAEILLRKSRQGIRVRAPFKLTALRLAVYDTVALTLNETGANFGWQGKVFRVIAKTFNQEGAIELVLQEESAASWDWDAGQALDYDPSPDTNLPDPFSVAPPTGVAFASGNAQLFVAGDGTVVSKILATWTAPADVFVTQGGQIELQYRDASLAGSPIDWADGNTQSLLVPGAATAAFLSPVQDGVTYDIRLRAINQLGAVSDQDDDTWANTLQHLVVGKTAAPERPDSFTVARLADGTRRFAWSHANPAADVRVGGGYHIRFATGSVSDWDAMAPLHTGLLLASPYETNELAAGTYSFAIKTIDSSGNESAEALFIQATLGDPRLRAVLVGRLEHDLGFPGSKTDCFVDSDGVLRSVGLGGWDSLPGSPGAWDDLPASWETILPSPDSIEYRIEIDLGADLSFVPLVTVEGTGSQTVTMRTGAAGESPQVSGPFVALAPVTAQRYIEISVVMTSAESPAAPTAIEALTILLDGATEVVDFNDVVTAGGDTAVFERIATGHFRLAAPSLSVISQARLSAIQNVGAGWSWELISKSAAAFGSPGTLAAEFKLYNGSGSLADATIDAELKGPASQ